MKRVKHLGWLLVLMVGAPVWGADTGPGEIKKVEVFPSAGEVRVEITLSAAVVPGVETAQNPDRLVVKLPGTTSNPQQKRIPVEQFGVRAVRFGLHQPSPPETDLVVDLNEEHPYKVTTEGAKIILLIQPSLREEARKRSVPAGAASKPLINSLGHEAEPTSSTLNSQNTSEGALLTPPPSAPPIQFPQATSPQNPAPAPTVASAEPPSARHPNRGSLEEGTVFPGAGTPGTGEVPPVSGAPQYSSPESAAGRETSTAASAAAPTPAPPQPAPAPVASTSGSTAASAPPAPAEPQAASKEPSSQSNPGIEGSVTASPAQGLAQAQPIPQEPMLSATPSPEPAPPVQQASETSLPTASGQASAESAAATAPKEPVMEEGSGSGHAPQIARREAENPDFRTAFRVKYVAQDTAYLDGGRAAGLAEGMKLVVRDLPNAGGVAEVGANSAAAGDVAELEVLSVAENSAVAEIHQPKRPVEVGDLAYLSAADQQALVEKNALSATRKYPAVVSFTENDTLDEEARTEVPRPPSPAVNRSRGRIGIDYIGVLDHGASNMYTNDVGLVVQSDFSRIGGTYWNATGYWRGRLDHTTGPQTLQDTINRTYQLYTSYDNPNSAWVAGFGRMYLPWATSIDTIDGGYAGRKLTKGVTTGLFLGSTPDPTSFSYAPNRQIGGAFVNFSGGSFDDLHYSSTTGGGLDMLSWNPDRPFVFFENSINYKRVFSIYQAAQVDSRSTHIFACPPSTQAIPECTGQVLTGSSYTGGTYTQTGTNWGLGRSFTTLRFMPHPRIEFNVNHTYYRDLPFLDPSFITSGAVAAGLFNQFLSQGVMGGARVEVLKQIWVNGDVGSSSYSGQGKNTLNQMFGITFGHVPWIKATADARYSKFNGSFGNGSFESFSLTRNLTEGMQFQFLAGQQNFASSLTSADHSRFINAMIESNLGRHYFIQMGGTISRGNQMDYDQWLFTFGYRFDNRRAEKAK